jgi:hypothetical protein
MLGERVQDGLDREGNRQRIRWIPLLAGGLAGALAGVAVRMACSFFMSPAYDPYVSHDALRKLRSLHEILPFNAVLALLGWFAIRNWSPRAVLTGAAASVAAIVAFAVTVVGTPLFREAFDNVATNLLRLLFRDLPEVFLMAAVAWGVERLACSMRGDP